MRNIHYNAFGMMFQPPVGLDGTPVSRTQEEYRYSYDAYVQYRNGDNDEIMNSVYSDRLYQWDSRKHDRLCKKYFGNEGQNWGNRNIRDIEKFLEEYSDLTNVKLIVKMEGCNVSNGYPYWVFCYSYDKIETTPDESGH